MITDGTKPSCGKLHGKETSIKYVAGNILRRQTKYAMHGDWLPTIPSSNIKQIWVYFPLYIFLN